MHSKYLDITFGPGAVLNRSILTNQNIQLGFKIAQKLFFQICLSTNNLSQFLTEKSFFKKRVMFQFDSFYVQNLILRIFAFCNSKSETINSYMNEHIFDLYFCPVSILVSAKLRQA